MSKVRYTRDLLSRTAPSATSLVDLMRRLDAPLLAGPRRYLRGRLAHYGIDTSHFADEPLPTRTRQRYTPERLREAAARTDSVSGMLAHMGVDPYNSARAHVAQRLERFGIDTSHFSRRDAPASQRLFPRAVIAPAVAGAKTMAGVMRALGHRPFDGSARAKHGGASRSTSCRPGTSPAGDTPPAAVPLPAGHLRRSSYGSKRGPPAPGRRCSAARSTTSESRTCAPSAASETSGTAADSCSRSTTSTATDWTTAGRTCATSAPPATARLRPSPGRRARQSLRDEQPSTTSKVVARVRTPAGQRAPV